MAYWIESVRGFLIIHSGLLYGMTKPARCNTTPVSLSPLCFFPVFITVFRRADSFYPAEAL